MQLLRDISTCGATAGVFAQPRPTPVISRAEIPQRSSLLPYRGVLSFRSKAREGPGSEPARVHIAARRRGGLAARGARAAAGDAAGRLIWHAAVRRAALCSLPPTTRR